MTAMRMGLPLALVQLVRYSDNVLFLVFRVFHKQSMVVPEHWTK